MASFVHAQEFNSTQEVIGDLRISLIEKRITNDTIATYRHYIERLVKRGNYIQADSLLTSIVPVVQTLNDSSSLADIYKVRANMYKLQRRFPKALEDYLWLKKYYESKKAQNDIVEIYTLLAEYYRAARNFNLMDVHLNIAEEIIKKYPIDKKNIAYWYGRKASLFTESINNYDSTIFYAEKSIALADESGDLYTKALALNEIGFIRLNHNDELTTSLKYLYESKDLLFKDERYRDYVQVMHNIALGINENDSDETLRILEQIIPLQVENNWYSPLIASLSLARYHYDLKQNFEKSDEAMHKIYQARIDELSSEKAIAVNELALTYANQLTKKELEVQSQKTQLAEAESLSNRRSFAISAIIAFFLAVISVIVFNVNRKFRKKNALLELRKTEIETTNTKLEKALKQQKALYKELNHRVKNNLTVLTGLIYLQESFDSEDNLKTSMTKLRNRIKSMAIAHESLYNSETEGKINFAAYLSDLFEELKSALTKEENVKTEIDCTDFDLELKHAVPLAMIMNELFTNSIKHGFKVNKEGLIHIKGQITDDQIIIDYKDNGSGYHPHKKKEFGLQLVELLLEQFDAIYEDKSSEAGFNIVLTFPNTIS